MKRISEKKLGTTQYLIVQAGKDKGYVTTPIVNNIVRSAKQVQYHMQRLVALGFFKKPETYYLMLRWEYIPEDSQTKLKED